MRADALGFGHDSVTPRPQGACGIAVHYRPTGRFTMDKGEEAPICNWFVCWYGLRKGNLVCLGRALVARTTGPQPSSNMGRYAHLLARRHGLPYLGQRQPGNTLLESEKDYMATAILIRSATGDTDLSGII